MRQVLVRLWRDDRGALLATEWVFMATILVIGVVTGLVAVRQSVLAELHEFANAFLGLDQSYSLSGQANCQSSTAGSCVFRGHSDSLPLTGSRSAACCEIEQSPCD
jgi:hypothetical protein